MGRRNVHLAKWAGVGKKRWIEACCEKYLKNGYVGRGPEARTNPLAVPKHIGLTIEPERVTCRSCLMTLTPEVADSVASILEMRALEGPNRIDTVTLLVTRAETFKIRVPENEPSSERAEIIAAAAARGKGAVAVRTKPTQN